MSDRSERDEKPGAASSHEFGKSTRRTFISRLGKGGLVGNDSSCYDGFRSIFRERAVSISGVKGCNPGNSHG